MVGNQVGAKVALRRQHPDAEGVHDERDEGQQGEGRADILQVVIAHVLGALLLPPLVEVEFLLVLDAEILPIIVIDAIDELGLPTLGEKL